MRGPGLLSGLSKRPGAVGGPLCESAGAITNSATSSPTLEVNSTNDMALVEEYDFIVCGAGTAGPAVAARLAEDPTLSILLVEAGQDNVNLENTQMVCAMVTVETPL